MVTATNERGHESVNRNPSVITVASVDVSSPSSFQRMVVLSDNDNADAPYTTSFDPGTGRLVFAGSLPEEIQEIVDGDHLYTAINGNLVLFLVETVLERSEDVAAFDTTIADLSAVFQDLDLSGDIQDPTADLESVELTSEEDEMITAILLTAPDEIIEDICRAVAGNTTEVQFCVSGFRPTQRRSLFLNKLYSEGKKLVTKSYRAAEKTVVKTIDSIADAIEAGIAALKSPPESFDLVNRNR